MFLFSDMSMLAVVPIQRTVQSPFLSFTTALVTCSCFVESRCTLLRLNFQDTVSLRSIPEEGSGVVSQEVV